MFDIFDYPHITSIKPEEQIKELQNYLVQFKETLEFVLMNISDENLSAELKAKLNGIGEDVVNSRNEQEEQLQQMAGNTITVSDVINSSPFKASLEAVEEKIPTDYLSGGSQTQTSEEDGGVNIFTFTNSDGTTSTFQCKNGNKGEKGDQVKVTMSVNFDTGNLEYTQT